MTISVNAAGSGAIPPASEVLNALRQQYGCGPVLRPAPPMRCTNGTSPETLRGRREISPLAGHPAPKSVSTRPIPLELLPCHRR